MEQVKELRQKRPSRVEQNIAYFKKQLREDIESCVVVLGQNQSDMTRDEMAAIVIQVASDEAEKIRHGVGEYEITGDEEHHMGR